MVNKIIINLYSALLMMWICDLPFDKYILLSKMSNLIFGILKYAFTSHDMKICSPLKKPVKYYLIYKTHNRNKLFKGSSDRLAQ